MNIFNNGIIESSRKQSAGKVLIVDDDAIARLILARWLQHWGVSFDAFSHPREAMSRLSEANYAFALIDFHMPQMNGLELIHEIQEAAERYNYRAPICALHTTDSDVKPRDPNLCEFLLKPVDPDRLHSLIRCAGCITTEPAPQKKTVTDNQAFRLRPSKY